MLVRLELESGDDVLRLDGVEQSGSGVQVQSGVIGLGLPRVQVQWLEGAGDGGLARGRRVLPRDIDLPLFIVGTGASNLQSWVSRLSRVLGYNHAHYNAPSLRLNAYDHEGKKWSAVVEHVGGGDYSYGVDSGPNELQTVITLRAGDPFFALSTATTVSRSSGGTFALANSGDARTYPVWTISSSCTYFQATSASGERIRWTGSLSGGSLIIDHATGMVADSSGANRYAGIDIAPRFWAIPPGSSNCTVSTDAGSYSVSWHPRRWMVI